MNAELASVSTQQRRTQLLSNPQSQFIGPEEFCELAVSSRRLQRVDDPEAGLRGLVDLETGAIFWTESDELFHFQAFS